MGSQMTHDELLAKVTHGYRWTCDRDREPWNALRAVVERHHPEEIHFGDVISQIECVECKVKYPCKTINDIEKELK